MVAAALLAKLDQRITIVRRPSAVDPAASTKDRYGNETSTPAPTSTVAGEFVDCWGAWQRRSTADEPAEEGGRNTGLSGFKHYAEPDADIRRTDIIRLYAVCDSDGVVDHTSEVLREWEIRQAELRTGFDGGDSHWEIETMEIN
jgi:hypothetical protein